MKHLGIKMALIGLMILAISGSANAQWLSLSQAGSAQKTVSLLQSGNNQIVFEINVPGFEKSSASTKGWDFNLLTIPGQGYNTAVGQPKLPVISEWLEIPQGATATAEFQILESREISLKELGIEQKIVPVQYPVPKIEGAADKIPFAMDENIYSKDKFFGQTTVKLSQPVSMRAKRAVLASFWPVAYNPVTGMLRIATKVKVTVNLSGSDQARTNSIHQKYSSKLYDRHVAGITINELAVSKTAKALLPAPVNQLIIVVDSFYTGIQPLVDWDSRKGYSVTVTKTSEIPGGADTTHIRQYIQSAYDGANPPDLVLLVGDVNGIPAHQSTEQDNPYTDLYYSTMAGSDIIPDLYASRISVANSTQLGYYLAKYLNYQQGSWGASQDWMSKAYFTSTNDPMHVVTDSTDNYCMALARAHGMVCDSLYAYYGTGTPVATAFNDGRTVMAYTGHGDVTYWAGPYFYQSDVNALTNAYRSTFVTSFACLTGAFNSSECFGETWIRTADKGAIAYWGSSVLSYWDEDDILQRRMFDAFLDSGYTLIGGMTVKAKLDLGRYYGWDQAVSVTVTRYFEQYNILGNAGVDLYTQQPSVLTVTKPDTVPTGPSQVAINVNDGGPLTDALVAIYQPSSKTLLASGYTDASGNAVLDINPGLPDSLAVTVTAHNRVPFQGRIQAYSANSYVSYLKNAVDDASGNNDGMLNPGETTLLNIWIKNYGLLASGAVACTLRAGSPAITVNDSTHSFSAVSAGDSVYYGFSVSVAAGCTNKTVLPFIVLCQDADSVRQAPFELIVAAPNLSHSSYSVNDPAPGGNNNNILEAGESDSLRVIIKNMGGQIATGTTAILSSSDPYLTITGNSAAFGDIAINDSGSPVPAYCLTVGAPPVSPYFVWVRLNIGALSGAYAKTDSFKIAIGNSGFFDNVEDTGITAKYSVQSQWHVTDTSSYSPGHSWWCGDPATGQYGNLLEASLITPDIILGPNSELSFWHKYYTELTYDFCNVEYSTNSGTNWISLGSFDGNQPAWEKQTYDLSSLAVGTVVKIRFHFTSDISYTYSGWYVDDIRVQETTGVSGTQTDPVLPSSIMLGLAYPNPSSGGSLIKYQLPKKITTELRVYNIAGQMVRTIQMGVQGPGNQSVFWNGRDQNDKKVSAGIYFYQLNAGGYSATKKLVVIK
ncbi:MAG: C25 family cysteine peptidase [bacterium]|nr:C25 family cysteine peptidase [bacterium]